MSTPLIAQRRRWYLTVSVLILIAGLQLAAIPPELFADPGVCFMDCNSTGKDCCCKQLAGLEAVEPHAPEAASHGRISLSRDSCRELCAGFAGKAPSDAASFLATARHGLTRSVDKDGVTRWYASSRLRNHSDPSTLPRPPPALCDSDWI